MYHDSIQGLYLVFMGKTLKRELDMLHFNLINESEHNFLTLSIQKKNMETTLAWKKFPEIRKAIQTVDKNALDNT